MSTSGIFVSVTMTILSTNVIAYCLKIGLNYAVLYHIS